MQDLDERGEADLHQAVPGHVLAVHPDPVRGQSYGTEAVQLPEQGLRGPGDVPGPGDQVTDGHAPGRDQWPLGHGETLEDADEPLDSRGVPAGVLYRIGVDRLGVDRLGVLGAGVALRAHGHRRSTDQGVSSAPRT